MPPASAGGVKRGKLHPEQGQVGGRNPVRRGRGALPSPRVGRRSRRATGGLRWMAITASNRGTELGLQTASLTIPSRPGGQPDDPEGRDDRGRDRQGDGAKRWIDPPRRRSAIVETGAQPHQEQV